MLILKIIVPLIFYNLVLNVVSLILPLGMSPLAVTGTGALVSLPPLYIFYRMEQKQRGKCRETDVTLLHGIPYIMLLAAASCILLNYFISISPLPGLFMGYEEQFAQDLLTPPLWVQLLCTVIAIPAAEELCFRGYIFALIRDKAGFWPAALFSALLFGLYHGNMLQGIYGFCLGYLLAWIYEKYRSVWASYLFHLTANLVSVLASKWDLLNNASGQPTAALLLIAGCLILVPFCILKVQSSVHIR